jgi:hypothetical protein
MNLVKKHNLKIDRQYDEADAQITLPKPTWVSLTHEQIMQQLDWSKVAFKLSTIYA